MLMMRLIIIMMRITSKGKYRAARNIEMSDPMNTGEL